MDVLKISYSQKIMESQIQKSLIQTNIKDVLLAVTGFPLISAGPQISSTL